MNEPCRHGNRITCTFCNTLEAQSIIADAKAELARQKAGLPPLKGPPVGIVPKLVWIQRRRRKVLHAMMRFAEANLEHPEEWDDELLDLNGVIKHLKKQKTPQVKDTP